MMTSFYNNYQNALQFFFLIQFFMTLSRIVEQMSLIIWQKNIGKAFW